MATRISLRLHRFALGSKTYFTESAFLSNETPASSALKRQPYPSTLPNQSVFETQSDEYDLSFTASLSRPVSSVQKLLSLVQKREFGSATQVLDELEAMHVTIPLHPAFEQVAIYFISESNPIVQHTSFVRWFRYIPTAKNSRPRKFHGIVHLLLHSPPKPNIPLILEFSLILASKGYATGLIREVVPFLVRLCEPKVSRRFLKDFMASVESQIEHPTRRRKVLGHISTLTVKAHFHSGRLDEAITVLRTSHKRKFIMSRSTYELVAKGLDDRSEPELASKIRRLKSFNNQVGALSTENTTKLRVYSSAAPLPIRIKHFKKDISASVPPSASDFLHLMQECASIRRTRCLGSLRRKALASIFAMTPRQPHRSANNWLLAEMMFLRKLRSDEEVLRLFSNYYFIIGVPDRLVRSHLEGSLRRRQMSGLPWDPAEKSGTPLWRLWPREAHLEIIWHALVSLSRGPIALNSLYKSFLNLSSFQNSPLPTRSAPTTPAILSPNEIHLLPFIRAFYRRIGPEKAIQVLRDMVCFGIRPGVFSYTELAGCFASAGDSSRAIAILNQMEQPANELPSPNIVTYTSILGGLVKSGRVAAAAEVKRRLIDNFGYQLGSNHLTDEVLASLSALERGSEPSPNR